MSAVKEGNRRKMALEEAEQQVQYIWKTGRKPRQNLRLNMDNIMGEVKYSQIKPKLAGGTVKIFL